MAQSAQKAQSGRDLQPSIISESMLIREEFFCGRKFKMANHNAIWFIEEDRLKIYANSGGLLRVLSGSEIDEMANRGPHQTVGTTNDGPPILKMPHVNEAPDHASDETRRAA